MLNPQQIEDRRQGIGGSDIAAVLGLSPYKTPYDLYLEKIGESEPDDLADNERVHFGNVLEDVVADEFSRRTYLKVRRNNQHIIDRDRPFLMANIDRAVTGKPFGMKCGLECKTTDKWAARPELWGPGATFEFDRDGHLQIVEADDQVPDWYLLQCAHYMRVTSADFWFLAVLVGGNDFRIYTIQRDLELEMIMLEHATRFWVEHVERRIPPPPSNVVDLEAMFSIDNGKSIDASPEVINTWAEVKELQAQLKAIETRLEGQTVGKTKIGGLKNQLRMAIGENSEVLLGSEGKPLATWKAPKAGRTVFDQDALKKDHPDIAKQYTKKVPGSRVLLIK